jgi:7,8-dihydropterin-6-yl-methyl-4-(beta-D-ribofuranosyl)aminobenzene 5'-phosphate synthase
LLYFKRIIGYMGVRVKEADAAQEIFTGVYTTGELGTWIKEQSLILTTGKGLVIITGCAHPKDIACK